MARLLNFPWISPRTSLLIMGLFLALGLAWPAPASADNDWLGIEVPQPMNDGRFDVNVKLIQTENQTWEDGADFHDLLDSNYNIDIQDLITLDTRLDWRVEPRLALELDVPTVFSEQSQYTGVVEYYSVDTPGVEESQGLGDVRLGLRGALRDAVQGFNAGWNLSLVAPTGLAPWDAPSSLAGTGDGRWQVLPGFVAGGQSENWEGWFQAVGRLQFGQQIESSSADYVSWNEFGGVSLPQGGIWLGPRYGGDSVAGLAWIWYRDADSRMGLAVEAKAHWLSPWTTTAGSLDLPGEEYFVLTPELQARYGPFSAVAGWQARYIWAVEEPAAEYGAVIFDVAFTF
jgi:hypothetical protein